MRKAALGLLAATATQFATPAIAMNETVIATLLGDNGFRPIGPLVPDGTGALYGLTSEGGGPVNGGVVFELTPPATSGASWTETVLHSFGTNDGINPRSLIVGPDGRLYGITTSNEPSVSTNFGTVWELAPPNTGRKVGAPTGCGSCWTETILYSATVGGLNGLTLGPNGDLFGTIASTDTSAGIIFRLAAPTQAGGGWTYTNLYTLLNASLGDHPTGFTIGPEGALYGLTDSLGNAAHPSTVFRLVPPAPGSNAPWKHEVLHEFINGTQSYTIGSLLTPFYHGSLYGDLINTDGSGGLVYELTEPTVSGLKDWNYTVLYTFVAPEPGKIYFPTGITLPPGSKGKLYGTTLGVPETVWVLVPPKPGATAWRYQRLFSFQNGSQGIDSYGPVFVQGQTVYGTTQTSDPTGASLVYQLTPPPVP